MFEQKVKKNRFASERFAHPATFELRGKRQKYSDQFGVCSRILGVGAINGFTTAIFCWFHLSEGTNDLTRPHFVTYVQQNLCELEHGELCIPGKMGALCSIFPLLAI